MGVLSRLFKSQEAEQTQFEPPSNEVAQEITRFGKAADFDGLARTLKSKNPYVRTLVAEATILAAAVSEGGTVAFEMDEDGHFVARPRGPLHPAALRLFALLLKDRDPQVRTAAGIALAPHRNDLGVAGLLREYRPPKEG